MCKIRLMQANYADYNGKNGTGPRADPSVLYGESKWYLYRY